MKIFQREQRSLFGEILDWMLTPLLLLWPVSLGLTWLVAQGIADKPFDRALEYNAQALAQMVVVNHRRVELDLPQPARELLRADDADIIYFQALGPRGELLAGEKDFPPPPFEDRALPGDVRLRDDEIRGVDVRVAYVWVQLTLPDGKVGAKIGGVGAVAGAAGGAGGAAGGAAVAAITAPPPAGIAPMAPSLGMALVQVAETREKRSVLATEIIKGVMLPQFVILPLAVLLVWLALARGIKPLGQLEDRIRKRKPDDLSPLDARAVPLEVAPLVQSVNDLLTRLKESIAAQKRFLADAAHQLKTPLAGLRMQADLAQREGADAAELKQSLQQIGRASVRATHTVNQLLALARAEGGGTQLTCQSCDMARVAMQAVQDALPHALEKRIDLGYDGAAPGDAGITVQGNPTLLLEMVRNLIDNAIQYGGGSSGGVVTARVALDALGQPTVQVEDNGPGIALPERALVFQPFYRTLGTGVDGTGLGLAIVQEIATVHGATVSLEDTTPGHIPPGVRFTVRFAELT